MICKVLVNDLLTIIKAIITACNGAGVWAEAIAYYMFSIYLPPLSTNFPYSILTLHIVNLLLLFLSALYTVYCISVCAGR